MSLTPAEQLFFETGNLEDLNATNPQGPTSPPGDPLALQALGTEPPAAAPAAPPAAAPAPSTPPVVQPDVSLETLQKLLADANSRAAELEVALRQQQAPQTPQAPDPGPDPTTDPLGAMFHRLDQVTKQIEAMQLQQAQQGMQSAQMTNLQQFQQQIVAMRDAFVKTTPDFPAAYEHMRNTRIADLRTFGVPDRDIPAVLFQEELQISQKAIQQGRNPAAVVYEMSKRHGYTPSAAPPGTPPAKGASIEDIQRAQSAAHNLAPTAPQASGDVTLDGLRAMSDKDLNQLVQNGAMWDKFTGKDEYPI